MQINEPGYYLRSGLFSLRDYFSLGRSSDEGLIIKAVCRKISHEPKKGCQKPTIFLLAVLVENSVKSTTEKRCRELLNQLKSEEKIAVYFFKFTRHFLL
jgi:hypothetical protein